MTKQGAYENELMRFYRVSRDGRWSRKSEGDARREVINKKALKRLWVSTTTSLRRFE